MDGALCIAPQYVAEDLLRARRVRGSALRRDEGRQPVHRAMRSRPARSTSACTASPSVIREPRRRRPILVLGGVHVGCYELFAPKASASIRELKGGPSAVPLGRRSSTSSPADGSDPNVGLDPDRDVALGHPPGGRTGTAPHRGKDRRVPGLPAGVTGAEGEEGRSRPASNSALDRPWAQYFCCAIVANRDFVRRHPGGHEARRARPAEIGRHLCAWSPSVRRGAWSTADTSNATTTRGRCCRRSRTDKWREYGAEDSVRFYALRLREAGMMKSSPQKILAQGTDWRFLEGLKKELKG